MSKTYSRMNKEELLAEVKRVNSLLEKEDGFFLIWSGLKKIQKRFRKEFPIFLKDLHRYGKESKAFFLEVRKELKL